MNFIAGANAGIEPLRKGFWVLINFTDNRRGCIHTYIHHITLHYITLHYITLHYITLHYITYIDTYIDNIFDSTMI